MEHALVAIHQSNLFPRIKVLTKLALADVYLTQNNVQFAQRDWQNRFRVLGAQGQLLVSVPVHRPSGRDTCICDVQIVDTTLSARKVRETIRHTYRRARYWPQVATYVDEVLDPPVGTLADLANRSVVAALARVAPQVVVAEWRQQRRSGSLTRSERLAKAVEQAGGVAYLTGSGGRRYVEPQAFARKNIRLLWQNWDDDAAMLGLGIDASEMGSLSVLHYIATLGETELELRLAALRVERRRQWALAR
jgi:WbqC-like protein family